MCFPSRSQLAAPDGEAEFWDIPVSWICSYSHRAPDGEQLEMGASCPLAAANPLCNFSVCFSDQGPDIIILFHDNFWMTLSGVSSTLPYQQCASLLSESFSNPSARGPPLPAAPTSIDLQLILHSERAGHAHFPLTPALR